MVNRGVVVIGNFDGVHLGHQQVLEKARESADGPLTVVTFWPHPLSVVAPEKAPKLLTDMPNRIELLKKAGADDVRVVEFTEEIAQLSPEEFVSRIINPLNPKLVVVGKNFRFGNRAVGDVQTLTELGADKFKVIGLPLLSVEDGVICSTRIRRALEKGDVRSAQRLLGRPFRFAGLVVMGDQRGRELGFPTANILVPEEFAVPADGVYSGFLNSAQTAEYRLPAAISVGTNPTFGSASRRVETYVIDRDDLELYGLEISVDFLTRIRGQIKFSGIEPLITQMKADVEIAKQATI